MNTKKLDENKKEIGTKAFGRVWYENLIFLLLSFFTS